MQYLVPLVDGLISFLEALELFFFSPINEVISRATSLVIGGEGIAGELFSSIFSWLSGHTLGAIGNLTLFQLILGSGIIVFLLYRLILFLVPVAD